jgi:serine/threonine-protein kinase HipA
MVDVADVYIWGELLGAVRWDDRQQMAFFQFAPNAINRNWDLSPIKMPISEGSRIFNFPELRSSKNTAYSTFNGLPGLLADALPDRYGNQLINAWLVKQGRAEDSMNPVEKLCFIGTRAMGALEFEPAQMNSGKRSFSVEIDSLIDIARKMLYEREAFNTNLFADENKAVQDLLKIGTSAGGARPKAVIAFNPRTGEVHSGQGNVSKGFEHWLIKLEGVSNEQFGESSGWARVEYAYYLMAKDCNIEISESYLLEENERAHFLTKRFDREANEKIHTQTLCGLQHYDFNDMFSYSYEQVFQTMRQLYLTYPEAEQMFRRMVFNVLATNYDDHTKNFSFLMKKDESWRLAPAYDLCFSYDETNHWVSQQTLSVNGKRLGIDMKDMLTIADANSIKKGESIIREMNEVIKSWKFYADKAGVRADLTRRIHDNLNVF